MASIKKLIRDWLNSDDRNHRPNAIVQEKYIPTVIGVNAKSINFTLRSATGGWVIETSRYDRHTDRHEHALYVLTDFDTLGQELSKIITVESLQC